MEEGIKTAAYLIVEAKKVVALTGAGISTESGISDFRTPGKGLWAKYDPAIYANYSVFRRDPSLYWQMAKDTRRKVLNAKPNLAHLSLAELEKMGKLESVITQNIDYLHQRAGSSNVIELHGTARTASCMLCAKKYDFPDVMKKLDADEIPPQCDCGGILKSDTILFGEPMPVKAINRAKQLAEETDLMLVVGSSLEVFPANSLPQITWERDGTHLILVNLSNTPFDYMWDIALYGRAGEILPKIVSHVKTRLESEIQ
ncbi:MAG: NAD-dependent protein deacylase [Candidatus Heimdallarchaeota archaeon]